MVGMLGIHILRIDVVSKVHLPTMGPCIGEIGRMPLALVDSIGYGTVNKGR